MIEIDFKIVILSGINFILLYIVLKKMFFSKIILILEKRKNSIRDKFNEIESDRKTILDEKNEINKRKKELSEEGKKIVRELKESGLEEKKEIIESAKKQAALIDKRARDGIKDREDEYIEKMKASTVEISVQICKRVLGDILSEEMQGEILDAYIERLEREDV